jgi:hypothetical protein
MKIPDNHLRISIIEKIVAGQLDSALDLLSVAYEVSAPKFRVGTLKGHRSVAACYIEREKMIVFSNRDILCNPSVVLHEFYHHCISQTTLKGGGTDKNADRYVRRFLYGGEESPVS